MDRRLLELAARPLYMGVRPLGRTAPRAAVGTRLLASPGARVDLRRRFVAIDNQPAPARGGAGAGPGANPHRAPAAESWRAARVPRKSRTSRTFGPSPARPRPRYRYSCSIRSDNVGNRHGRLFAVSSSCTAQIPAVLLSRAIQLKTPCFGRLGASRRLGRHVASDVAASATSSAAHRHALRLDGALRITNIRCRADIRRQAEPSATHHPSKELSLHAAQRPPPSSSRARRRAAQIAR